MAVATVEITYGTALLDVAREIGREHEILDEAKQIAELLKEDEQFRMFMCFPGISGDEKKKVVENIFRGRICDELLNFLKVLIDKRRFDRYESIIKVYETNLEKEEGITYGEVYSVKPLTSEQLREIEDKTSDLLQCRIKLTNEIDVKLIAGIKILVDGKVIDASYRARLNEMAKQINI